MDKSDRRALEQRVGIARTLANDPQILLMDEPFGSLDYLTKLKVQDFLLNLRQKKKLTILFVTHNIDEAIKLSDKIVVLSKRPARIKDIIRLSDNDNHEEIKQRILENI